MLLVQFGTWPVLTLVNCTLLLFTSHCTENGSPSASQTSAESVATAPLEEPQLTTMFDGQEIVGNEFEGQSEQIFPAHASSIPAVARVALRGGKLAAAELKWPV